MVPDDAYRLHLQNNRSIFLGGGLRGFIFFTPWRYCLEFCANRLDDLTEITVKELRFYSLNATKYQNDVYKTNKVNAKVLKSLPERYFSDIMYEVAIACKK